MTADYHVLTTVSIGLVGLAWLWLVAFARLRRDNYRSDLRSIRDELFDFMVAHRLDMKDQAYRETRASLNALLQWSIEMNLFSFVVAMFIVSRDKKTTEPNPVSPSPMVNQAIDRAKKLAMRRVLKFIFLEGTVGALVRCMLFLLQGFASIAKVRRTLSETSAKVLDNSTSFGRSVVAHGFTSGPNCGRQGV